MNFQEIYTAHKSMVYNLVLQYTQNTEDAEEITQDVFLKIYNNLESFKKESELKTWVYRITINQALDFLKAKKNRNRWSIFSAFSSDEKITSIGVTNFNHPGVELEQKEALAFIFTCIDKLPENQKTVIILLKIEQLSQAESAEVMQLSSKAIESLFQRAKKNLEKLLIENEG
ncbi:MAG: RNA polymerase sigma factor [Flavobacteriales bacterium]